MRSTKDSFLHSPQGPLFVAGCCLLALWIAAVAVLWRLQVPLWNDIIAVSFAHALAGRAISIAHGTFAGLPRWLLVFLATYADTTIMFLFYPLFVYSYEHLTEGDFVQRRMQPMLRSAQKNVDSFGRYKILGVFFFVWIPLWMTGIIAGAILGYLLGLSNRVTIITVILGALAAVASWVYAYDWLFAWLANIHQGLPMVATLAIIGGLIVYRWRRRRKAKAELDAGEDSHSPGGNA